MERSTDEGLFRDAAGDRIVDLADHRAVTTDLEVQAGTRAEATPARLDVRRVDHPLGVVLTLGGELDLATVPVLQERLDHAMRGKAAVVIDLSRLRFIDSSVLVCWCARSGTCATLACNSCWCAARGLCTASLRSRAWILTSSFTTPQARPYEPRSCDVLGARRIPQPARTDRPRPSSTATSQE